MNDCLWCGSLAHVYEDCPERQAAVERDEYLTALTAALSGRAHTGEGRGEGA